MFVDLCADDECCALVLGQRFGKARKFYVGDEYCRHLREEYGHRVARMEDRQDGREENLLDGWAD